MFLVALLLVSNPTAKPQDDLAAGFRNPPAWARPHTWWHWMDGNVTKAGIDADLRAMKEVGIGGAQMFGVSQSIPPGPVKYMGKEWREMIHYAVKEASKLGIELCSHNGAGWSSSGGPWITPANGMQVIAWSTATVRGPSSYSEILPIPQAPAVYAKVPYYKDIAVYAYPTPTEAAAPRPADFLGRTGVQRQDGLEPDLSPYSGPVVKSDGIVMLTDKMDASGRLRWEVPPGDWTVLRIGHVPTGVDNHPAPPEGDGLEVDKLSRSAFDTHWTGMMAKILSDAGPLAGKTFNNSLIDSYEVGDQNWSPKFRVEFQKRRGYDPLPYLPVIAGQVVDSKEVSERFLWDLRRTIADLYADNYYGYFAERCHQAGIMASAEPYGDGGFDNIQSGGKVDIPMGEFWIGGGTLETTKLASSVGHVYGRRIVGAESFTAGIPQSRWQETPYGIKALGDLAFCNGINRYIFHRYAMQPWLNLYPGMTMGPWGTHLERTQTWWTEARAWMKYIARAQYLLQQGKFVADALYCEGEGAPADLPYGPNLKPHLPDGYDYDGCDASMIYKLAYKNGSLVLPSGMSYRILVLPSSRFMTVRMIHKIRDLVEAGATVVAAKPDKSPSLQGYPECDSEVQSIASQVWGDIDGTNVTEHPFGNGKVVDGRSLKLVLDELNVRPDFSYTATGQQAKLADIHRSIGDTQVYFVSNQRFDSTEADCTFRAAGLPELWHADTGKIEIAPVYRLENGLTTVQLHFEPAESVFVVFRRMARSSHLTSFGSNRPSEKVATPKIVILKARYESADGRGADVTDTVASMVREGQFEIPANNGAFGDPVVNVVKRLHIQYTKDGVAMDQTVPENDTLYLLQLPAAKAEHAEFELSSIAGSVLMTPWKPGTYFGTTQAGKQFSIKVGAPKSIAVGGPWRIAFQPHRGAPSSITADRLFSWPDSKEFGVKYFSGSAVYSKEIQIPASFIASGREVVLDLGTVKNFATVRLNGRELAVLWKEPFEVNLTGLLRTGNNRLEVKVTNLWPNRMIGDEHFPPDAQYNTNGTLKGWPEWLAKGEPRPKTGRVTFSTWHFYKKDSPLLESGLIGPVVLRSARRIVLPQ